MWAANIEREQKRRAEEDAIAESAARNAEWRAERKAEEKAERKARKAEKKAMKAEDAAHEAHLRAIEAEEQEPEASPYAPARPGILARLEENVSRQPQIPTPPPFDHSTQNQLAARERYEKEQSQGT